MCGRVGAAAWLSLSSTVVCFPRDAMLARVLAMVLCLSVCVCLSQVGVLLKWFDGSNWFSVWRLLSPTLCSIRPVVSIPCWLVTDGDGRTDGHTTTACMALA